MIALNTSRMSNFLWFWTAIQFYLKKYIYFSQNVVHRCSIFLCKLGKGYCTVVTVYFILSQCVILKTQECFRMIQNRVTEWLNLIAQQKIKRTKQEMCE